MALSISSTDRRGRFRRDTVKPRLIEADADLERVLVIDDRDTPLTLADERKARAIQENNARLVIIDPVQAFLGADVDMNRANEVRPIFRSLGDSAQATGCAIVLIPPISPGRIIITELPFSLGHTKRIYFLAPLLMKHIN